MVYVVKIMGATTTDLEAYQYATVLTPGYTLRPRDAASRRGAGFIAARDCVNPSDPVSARATLLLGSGSTQFYVQQ